MEDYGDVLPSPEEIVQRELHAYPRVFSGGLIKVNKHSTPGTTEALIAEYIEWVRQDYAAYIKMVKSIFGGVLENTQTDDKP